MREVKQFKISPVTTSIKVGEWYHGAKVELYPRTENQTNIVWSSNKSHIAAVNPVNGYVYANNPGIAIITARIDTAEPITACYTIVVENNEQISIDTVLSKEAIANSSNLRLTTRSNCDGYSDMAFGYSGTVYSYTISGNTATLKKGILSKTNSYNYYAASFQSALYDMAVIYDSFSPLQRQAWLVLRGYGLLTAFSIDAIDMILLVAGIDLQGQLESTVLGMNEWYQAEERAQNCFSLF